MRKLTVAIIGLAAVIIIFGASVFRNAYASNPPPKNAVVGVWYAKFPDAPFKYHMVAFNADGTMQQANPDAGDAHTSDSDGMGIWVRDGNKVKGKFVEIMADRKTHAFVSRGEISFEITVDGDTFSGGATAKFFDQNEKIIAGPIQTGFTGSRVTLP